ncbi:MAG: aminopeptidase P family protein, partial [Acetobacteraceae bacterium]|nr:aminopeptidase P family protein [Acetobacteraceae bacterium]
PHLVDGSGCVEQARAVKSAPELAYMRDAAQITDAGIAAAIAETCPGATENDLAAAAFAAMTRAGSEWMAKDPIVTTGDRAGIPHTTYMGRALKPGDTVLLEFSAVKHRYFAPLMRSGWLGQLDPRMRAWPDICQEALETAISCCRPGVNAGEVDAQCRAVIENHQCWLHYRKRAGYSVGIGFASWIEGAISTMRDDYATVLQPGMCFHIPVAMRLYGEGTVGISQTVVVTENGAKPLHAAPAEFFVR